MGYLSTRMSDARRAFDSKKKNRKHDGLLALQPTEPPQTLSTFWVEEMFAQGSSKISRGSNNAIRVPFAVPDRSSIKSLER